MSSLASWLKIIFKEGHSGSSLATLKAQIIDAAANRLVFLVGLELGQVGFEIRSLQEFMAAEGITDGSDAMIQDRLRAIAATSHWRNVFLFAAGKCFSERRHLRDTIQALCAELNENPDMESFRVLHVGSELALDLLEDGPARKVPITAGPLTRLAIQLLGTPFNDVLRLVNICEEGTRYIFEEDLRERMLGPANSQRPEWWACLAALIERFGGEFEQLGHEVLELHPWKDIEFEYAAEMAGGQNKWLADSLFEFVCTKTPALGLGVESVDPDGNDEESADRASSIWPPDTSGWLSWYTRYSSLNWSIQHLPVVRISAGKGLSYATRFNRLSSGLDDALITPSELPAGGMWSFFRAVSEFCQRPSSTTLADALRAESAVETERGMWSLLAYKVPWPLAEVLQTKRAEPGLLLAEFVERGGYGDVRDWLEWEQRWLGDNSFEEIIAEPNVFETTDGGLFRFPFRCASFLVTSDRRHRRLPPIVLESFDRSESHVVRRFLAQIGIGSMMPIANGMEQLVPTPGLDEMVFMLCKDSDAILPAFFRVIDYMVLEDQRWSDFFAQLTADRVDRSVDARISIRAVDALNSVLERRPDLRESAVRTARCKFGTSQSGTPCFRGQTLACERR